MAIVIEVNEAKIYSTGLGANEWTMFRSNTVLGRRFEDVGFRSPMGALCQLPFDSRDDAREFADGIAAYLHVHPSAVRVRNI